ncbi:MAG: hypothetical protein GXO16_08865, partial [Epsilonproteobacteria bacterium]|nr:hypothetical protein [Campylobacterota bacterium]
MIDFEKEVQELLERAYGLVGRRASKEELRRAVLELLEEYNDEVRRKLEEYIFSIVDRLPPDILVGPTLSERLYANAKEVAPKVAAILVEHIGAKKTIGDLAKKLYEGYGFRDKETLEVAAELPAYLKKELGKPSVRRALERKVAKLRTSPLRAAYSKIVDEISNIESRAFAKAYKVALEEKARYYATRIA